MLSHVVNGLNDCSRRVLHVILLLDLHYLLPVHVNRLHQTGALLRSDCQCSDLLTFHHFLRVVLVHRRPSEFLRQLLLLYLSLLRLYLNRMRVRIFLHYFGAIFAVQGGFLLGLGTSLRVKRVGLIRHLLLMRFGLVARLCRLGSQLFRRFFLMGMGSLHQVDLLHCVRRLRFSALLLLVVELLLQLRLAGW